MTKTLSVVVTAALALSLSGCGASAEDDSTAATAISDRLISAQETNSSDFQLLTWKPREADCVGTGLVREIGTEQLQEYGVLDDDLKAAKAITAVSMETADAKAATDIVFGCADVSAMAQGALAKSDNVPARMRTCASKAMTDTALRPVILATFEGKQDEATAAFTEPLSTCALGNQR